MNIAARTVPLGVGRIIFDVNQGFYRLAYWHPIYEGDKQVSEERFAVSRAKLIDALTVVLSEASEKHGDDSCPHDPLTVERYMREQRWGRELP